MPRGRMLSRSISTSRRIESMSEWAQLLFDRVVVWADDFGRIEADPVFIKAEAKPLSRRSEDEFADGIAEGVNVGAYIAYADAAGRMYLQVERADEHQKGLHKRTSSRYPDPAACQRLTADEYLDKCQALASGAIPVRLNSGEIRGNSGPEEKGREEKRTEAPCSPPASGGSLADEAGSGAAVKASPEIGTTPAALRAGTPARGETKDPSPRAVRTRKKAATHMTAEWEPSEATVEKLTREFPQVNVLSVVAEFRDWWIGAGQPKSDWDATFRNRVRQINADITSGNRRAVALFGKRAGDTGTGAEKPRRTAADFGAREWSDVRAELDKQKLPPLPS